MDVGGGVADEEDGDVRDLFGRADAAEWNAPHAARLDRRQVGAARPRLLINELAQTVGEDRAGLIALTRIPSGPASAARPLVKFISAALAGPPAM